MKAIIKHIEVRDDNNDTVLEIFTKGDKVSKVKVPTHIDNGSEILEMEEVKELIALLPLDLLDLLDFYKPSVEKSF